MVSLFNEAGFLPGGIHELRWSELEVDFATNYQRQKLLKGLLLGLHALRVAGCERVYLDGSFVTAKPFPNDIDVCYESGNMNFSLLDPVLKDFSNFRSAQKHKYGCEFFEAEAVAVPDGTIYLDFFQQNRDGTQKGIIAINLTDLPEEVSND